MVGDGPRAVVVYLANVRAGPGQGARLGEIQPDVVVRVGATRDGWRQVELEGEIKTRGWLLADRLGCRILQETELEPFDGKSAKVTLRAGALVSLMAQRGDRLEVLVQDPITKRGTVDVTACGVGEPFVPSYPRGATPHKLTRDAMMVSGEPHGGEVVALPSGYRFAVESTDGRMVVGWTDGPVVVRGRIEGRAVERDRSTPLDILAQPLGYTHEVVLDADILETPGGDVVARLAGGTPVTPVMPVTNRSDWVEVRTFGAIRVEGWIEDWAVRRIALDHNELEPLARRRVHTPPDRDIPRGMEPSPR